MNNCNEIQRVHHHSAFRNRSCECLILSVLVYWKETFHLFPCGTKPLYRQCDEGRFNLDIGKKFFTVRIVRPWHSLPRAAVEDPGNIQNQADGALSNLVRWKVSLPLSGVGTRWSLQPK